MALASNTGVDLALTLPGGLPGHALLLGEDQAGYLIAIAEPDAILTAARVAGVTAVQIGKAGGEALVVEGLFTLSLARLRAAHEAWLPAYIRTSNRP